QQAATASRDLGVEQANAEKQHDAGDKSGGFKFGSAGHGGLVGRITDLDALKKLAFDCQGSYEAAKMAAGSLASLVDEAMSAPDGASPQLAAESATLKVAPALYEQRVA